ncbi:MAG: hypothetical protein JWM27_3547 [Gemmatimonadetes bacterium]|nr:hypothetical protein [Gemmatimonadota bacterium]
MRTLRGARSAQASFERARFEHMPWSNDSGGSPGYCDEIVGRFCFWFGDKHDDWVAPPEHAAVTTARQALLERLGAAAARQPGDEWVVGQLVRYQVEGGRAADALAAARACRAQAWWCRALAGYALHAAGDFAGAEAAFDSALAVMQPRARHEWTDLSILLSPGDRGRYRHMRGPQKDSVERAFWSLADPLLATPGNEARTEHLSRWVMARLQERARSPDGMIWADDLGEFLIRYGQPQGWERIRPRTIGAERAQVVSHYASHAWAFLPSLKEVADPLSLKPNDMDPDPDRPRVQYPLVGARSFTRLDPQVALFRRGGRGVLVAAYDLDRDSVPAGVSVDATLSLLPRAGQPTQVRVARTGATGALHAELEPAPVLLSLEARAADSAGRTGRARFGVRVDAEPAGVHLSDVLLLSATEGLPATLEAAEGMARGSAHVRAGERVGLFWEVYGLTERPDTLSVSVSIIPITRPGFARRAAERMGLAAPTEPVSVGWKEEAGGQTVLARSVAVAVPAVRPGDYQLRVTVHPRGRDPVTATRILHVDRPPAPDRP